MTNDHLFIQIAYQPCSENRWRNCFMIMRWKQGMFLVENFYSILHTLKTVLGALAKFHVTILQR